MWSSAIIQKYVRGEDWGLNVLCRDGEIVAHTTQRNLVHEGNVFGTPIGLTITPNEELLKTVAGLLKELNWNGVANLDFRRVESSNSFLLVDFNPRFWGSLIASTLAGVNFPLLTCLMALGENQVETSPQNLSYAKTRCWLRETVRRSWKRRSGTPLTFRTSGLAVSADDPMPDISRVFRRMIA